MKFILCEAQPFFLRMGLCGPSGSGKSYTALKLATELGEEPVGVIDTEAGSAKRYADRFARPFFTVDLERFSPADYLEAMQAAVEAGIKVLVIDSLSHAWMGKGGVLEMVDTSARRQARGGVPNSFSGWREATPEHNKLVDVLLRLPIHLIVTMRTKTEYIVEQTAQGKSVPRKVGLAPVQRDGLEYEFDLVGELSQEHDLVFTKTRCPQLSGTVFSKPGADLAHELKTWVSQGGKSPWVKQIEALESRQDLLDLRERLNAERATGIRFSEMEQKQIRQALDEAKARWEVA